MSAVVSIPSAELADLRSQLGRIEQRLNEAFAPATSTLPQDALEAVKAREIAKTRGYHVVETFAPAIGRSTHWVSDRCRLKIICTLPGGKPYRIPLTEEARFMTVPS